MLEADGRGALGRQRNVIVAFLGVPDEQTLRFFEVFQRADEIRVGKLGGAGEEFFSQNVRACLALKEGQHVFFNLLESSSIHFFPGVVD